ncbi:DUF637 domain-containing protein, partial [Pseudomonas protegens]|uniref:DUF637 domain-containing protein n=1 Tax=Pseudomonas protegens TaxID=380021 RepID=UPI0038027280
TMVSSKITAGNEAYLVAGNQLNFLANQDSDYSLYDMKKKGSWGAKKTKRDEVTDVKAVGSEVTSGGDLTLESGGDQLYQGAKVASGSDLTIDSGGAVTFDAVKDLHQESHEKSKGDLAWNSMKGKGNTDETLRQSQLVAQGQVVIKAVDGLRVDLKQIDQKSVSQTIDAMVQADPQLAWLKEVEKRGDVDWRQVKEVHDSFKYSHSGLGAGAQMVIAILIAYFTAGAASGLVASGASAAGASTTATAAGGMWAAGSGASLQGIGWANAMVTAGAMGMTSNAAISTINNKGNLSLVLNDVTSKDALRGYAVSGITAGLTTGLFEGWTGTKTDVAGAAGTSGAVVNTTTVLPPGGLSTLEGIGRFAGSQMLQNGTSAVLDRALGGNSSFSDALHNSLVNTFAAAGFKWVGDISGENKLDLKDGGIPKVALHALMGGLAAEAAGGDFKVGALSAGVNEAVVGLLADQYTQMSKEEKNRLLVMNSQLIGVLTAAAAGGEAKDLQTGSWVAGSATSYNRLLHDAEKKALTTEAAELQKRLGKPGTDLSWDDLLLLAANAQVDETENKRLQALLQMYDPKKPEGQHFAENLLIAQQSIAKLAAQDIVLTWKDGRPIMADGDEVKAFQSTGKQFQDHGLFNTDSKWTQASGNSWAGDVNMVPEAWKRQFGEKNAALYMREIGLVSSSPAEMKDLMERISIIATGGVKDVTVDLDIALAMTGAPAVLRALLAKRVSAAMAEAGGASAGKDVWVDAGGSAAAKATVTAERAALPAGYREGGSVGAAFNETGGLPEGYRRVVNTKTGNIEVLATDGKLYFETGNGLRPKAGGNLAGLVEAEKNIAGAKGTFTPKDFPEVAAQVSRQKQLRHLEGTTQLADRGKGGYMSNAADAQKVLDAYRSGNAVILGKNAHGFPVVRVDGVTGTNVNIGAGIKSQPTNVFVIKGTTSPSIVPTSPNPKLVD